jgi:hypothetical protein
MRFPLIQKIAAEHYERHAGNLEAFKASVESDSRLAKLSPEMIFLVIRLCVILYNLWQSRQTNAPTLLCAGSECQLPEDLPEEFDLLLEAFPDDESGDESIEDTETDSDEVIE